MTGTGRGRAFDRMGPATDRVSRQGSLNRPVRTHGQMSHQVEGLMKRLPAYIRSLMPALTSHQFTG